MKGHGLDPLTIELPPRVASNIAEFRGRAWLLPTLLKWLQGEGGRVFLLTGDPGTGKSMLMAWLAGLGPAPPDDPTAAAALNTLRGAVKAVHFCRASTRNIAPQAFAEAVSHQLAQSLPGFGEALAKSLSDRVNIVGTAIARVAETGSEQVGVAIGRLDLSLSSDEVGFDRAFVAPLKTLPSGALRSPVLLLVDALDEAQTYGGTTLVELLSKLDDLPAGIRILASTRDEPRVLKYFRGAKPFDLTRDAEADDDDVRHFALEQLARLPLAVEQREAFARRLANRAKGVFLYAAMVLEQYRSDPAPTFDLETLPKGLDDIYHAFLTRELGRDERRWYELYEPLLGLLVVGQGEGLTATQLSTMTGRDIRAPLRACKQYITGELPDGPFRPFHKSFADFLLEANAANADYRIDPRTWHGRIADHYLRELRAEGLTTIDDYGQGALCLHLLAAGRVSEAVELIGPAWWRLRQEGASGTLAAFDSDVRLVWQAALVQPEMPLHGLVRLRAAVFAVHEGVDVYTDQDLALLVDLGRSVEATAHARLRAAAKPRADSLRRVIAALKRSGTPPAPLIAEARQAALSIDDVLERIQSLFNLVELLAPAARMEPIDLLVRDIGESIDALRDAEQRAQGERILVDALGMIGRLDDGRRLADSIGTTLHQAFARKSIAVWLAKAGRFADALSLVRVLQSQAGESYLQRIAAETLSEIALAQALAHDQEAPETFASAEKASRGVREARGRDDALHDLALALTAAGDLAEATRVADSITDWQRDYTRVDIVRARLQRGDLEEAQRLHAGIEDEAWRAHGLKAIAEGLADAGRLQDARACLARLSKHSDRLRGLLRVAAAVRRRGDGHVEPLLTEVGDQAGQLEGEERREVLSSLTGAWLEAGSWERAADTFRSIHPKRVIARDLRRFAAALRAVAVAHAAVGDPGADRLIQAARRAIARVEPLWRDGEEAALAIGLAGVGRIDESWALLAGNRTDPWISRPWLRLAHMLLSRGETSCASQAHEQALAAARRIPNDSARDQALVEVASALERAKQFDMLEEVSHEIANVKDRCGVLVRAAVGCHAERPQHARELLAGAERIARGQRSFHIDTLGILAAGFARCGWIDDAWRVVDSGADWWERVAGVCAIARSHVVAKDPRGRALLEEGLLLMSGPPEKDTLWRWMDAARLREKASMEPDDDPLARTLWDEAKALSGTPWGDWQVSEVDYRADALRQLFEVSVLLGDGERVFGLARTALQSIDSDNDRNSGLLKLMRSAIRIERHEWAELALEDVHREQERRTAIAELVQVHAEAGRPDDAQRIARLERSDYYRRELTHQVAIAFAKADRPRDALQAIDELSLDGFIEAVATAQAALPDTTPGKSLAAVNSAIEVSAWVRADWQGVLDGLRVTAR